MARQAILSDIHANQVALERALADCLEQQVDEIVCTGDIVGYGPDPIECVDLVRTKCKWALCGNHDWALLLPQPLGFNKIARAAIEWHVVQLRPSWMSRAAVRERWDWLRGLNPRHVHDDVLYVHASPRDPLSEYVEEGDTMDLGWGPSQKIVEIFEKIPRLAFCGHSHRPGIVNQNFLWTHPHELPGHCYELPSSEKTLINVGSVGQPRDQNPMLCYVIYDTGLQMVEFRRLEYDIHAAQRRFQAVPQLPERCWRRLESGV